MRSHRDKAEQFTVRMKVWVEQRGESLVGSGRGELLRAVHDEGSISAAARALDMSYATAWNRLDAMGRAAGTELIDTRAGGHRGGGAVLTPTGRAVLAAFEHLQQRVAVFRRELESELAALVDATVKTR